MRLAAMAVLMATILIINACKKESNQSPTSKEDANNMTIGKVNLWLNAQQAAASKEKAETIKSLKDNLDFPNLRFEEFNDSE